MIIEKLDDDINPYLHSDEMERKLTTTHYVLGQNELRDMQKRAKQRRKETEEMMIRLGVQDLIKPKRNQAELVEEVDLKLQYLKHKTIIDEAFDVLLQDYSLEEIREGIIKYINNNS